jgi:N-acetylglucosamine kinase-like BadF-type ATPase
MGLLSLEENVDSELMRLVLQAWNLDEKTGGHEVMLSAITAGKDSSRFAELAPQVHQLAVKGNPDALALVSETGEILGRLIATACRRAGMTPGLELPVVFMGSLAQAWRELLCDPVCVGAGDIGTDIRITDSLLPAYGGAALLGLNSLGISVGEKGIERLKKGLTPK